MAKKAQRGRRISRWCKTIKVTTRDKLIAKFPDKWYQIHAHLISNEIIDDDELIIKMYKLNEKNEGGVSAENDI